MDRDREIGDMDREKEGATAPAAGAPSAGTSPGGFVAAQSYAFPDPSAPTGAGRAAANGPRSAVSGTASPTVSPTATYSPPGSPHIPAETQHSIDLRLQHLQQALRFVE
eukprot:1734547-Lingulodinium_polyedra.AAC.1